MTSPDWVRIKNIRKEKDLSPPVNMRHISVGHFQSNKRMQQLVNEVLTSGQISYGNKSRKFERDFARLHGCQYGLLANSGTSALQVALQAMHEIHLWRREDQVILPATTFIATANIVRHVGMRPIFVDVDEHTFNMDVGKLEPLINRNTRAIIPVHLLGQPADVSYLRGLLQAWGKDIKILEDSCECMFATHREKPVGSLGDIAAFSTYVAHTLVTGVGGIVTTNNPEYAGKVRSLLNHGLALEQLNPDAEFSPQPMLGRRFIFDSYGHSYRLTEFEAALGLAQLETWQKQVRTRQQLFEYYQFRLFNLNKKKGEVFRWQRRLPANTLTPMMFAVVLKKGDKTPLMQHLNAHGIETRDIPSILGHQVYDWLSPGDFPVSKWLLESGFYVGCHPGMTLDDVDYVCDVLEGWLDGN